MHLLPPNLGPVADLAAKDVGKYAMTGVRLEVDAEAKAYTAAATDGKRLLVVTGPLAGDPDGWPEDLVAQVAAAPNGQAATLVPADRWKAIFKEAAANAHKRRGGNTRSVAVAVGEKGTTFANTAPSVTTVPVAEGRFPPYRDVLPRPEKALVSVPVDPGLLVGLLKAAGAYTDDESRRVTLEVHRNGHVVVRTDPELHNGQGVAGLVVGLDKPTRPGDPPDADELERRAADAERTADRLREKVEDLEGDVESARKRLDELYAEKAALLADLERTREVLAGREARIDELAHGPGLEPAQQPGENDPPAEDEPDRPVLVPAPTAPPESARPRSRRERLAGVAA